jgi:hypothetical protein
MQNSNQMKTALNLTRWIVGILALLVSIPGFAGGDIALASILVIIALSILPPVAGFISIKLRKPALDTPVLLAAESTPFNENIIYDGNKTSLRVVKDVTVEQPQPKIKSTKPRKGLLGWVSAWGSAIKTVYLLEACIKQFPDVKPASLNKLLQKKAEWDEGEIATLSKRVIDKYHAKVDADNLNPMGQRYLDFYLSIFPEHTGAEITHKINVTRVEAFLFSKVNDDEALDPSEIQDVIAYSKSLDVKELDTKEKISNEYGYYIMNWELDNKVFQGLPSDFMLDKNELCIYKLSKCELVKRKSVTRNISYGGASYRMKMGKGLSYRIGSYSVSSQKETIEVSEGYGILNVTTRRILFKGKEGVVTINTNSIVDMEPFKDAVIIHKTTGKPISLNTADGLTLYKYLRSASRYKR